jgi:hypothetical protein
VFVVWTLLTWALAILGLVLVPGSLGFVALAHSVVTVAVVVALVAWAGRHLGRGLFRSLLGPVIAGGVGFGAAALLPRAANSLGAWTAHPIAQTLAAISMYFVVLLALERRTVVEEFRSLVASIRRKRQSVPESTSSDDASVPRAA